MRPSNAGKHKVEASSTALQTTTVNSTPPPGNDPLSREGDRHDDGASPPVPGDPWPNGKDPKTAINDDKKGSAHPPEASSSRPAAQRRKKPKEAIHDKNKGNTYPLESGPSGSMPASPRTDHHDSANDPHKTDNDNPHTPDTSAHISSSQVDPSYNTNSRGRVATIATGSSAQTSPSELSSQVPKPDTLPSSAPNPEESKAQLQGHHTPTSRAEATQKPEERRESSLATPTASSEQGGWDRKVNEAVADCSKRFEEELDGYPTPVGRIPPTFRMYYKGKLSTRYVFTGLCDRESDMRYYRINFKDFEVERYADSLGVKARRIKIDFILRDKATHLLTSSEGTWGDQYFDDPANPTYPLSACGLPIYLVTGEAGIENPKLATVACVISTLDGVYFLTGPHGFRDDSDDPNDDSDSESDDEPDSDVESESDDRSHYEPGLAFLRMRYEEEHPTPKVLDRSSRSSHAAGSKKRIMHVTPHWKASNEVDWGLVNLSSTFIECDDERPVSRWGELSPHCQSMMFVNRIDSADLVKNLLHRTKDERQESANSKGHEDRSLQSNGSTENGVSAEPHHEYLKKFSTNKSWLDETWDSVILSDDAIRAKTRVTPNRLGVQTSRGILTANFLRLAFEPRRALIELVGTRFEKGDSGSCVFDPSTLEVEGILISAFPDGKIGVVELSSSIVKSMRANRLSQFSGKSDAWLGEDGFTDEERGRQLRTRAFPSIGSANHLVPEQHELLLSEEQTLGNIAFCGNYHDLTDYFNRKNESRMEPHKPIQDIVPHVLEKAVEGGQSEIVRWLLTQKDVRPQPYAFRLAAAQGSPGVMETLIEHASTEYEGPSPLHLAAEYGNVNVVKMLVTRDKEWRMFDKICSIEKSPLDLAVMEGFPVVVDLLLDHIRTSPKAGERYDDALGIALRARETEKKNEDSDSERKSDRQVVLDHLTERALDFHLTERALGLHLTERPLGKPDPLHDVVDAGNEVLLDCILGAKVDQRNLDLMKKLERCLISAASFGHTNILQRLLDFGVPPQPQISKGATALIQACIQGHHEAVRLLIRHKAQPLTPWRGLTSFHWTVKKGHLKIVRFFLDRGILGLPAADTSKPVNTNLSLLHLAVSSKKTEIVRAILKFGVSTEVRDGHEETALHAAVRRSNEGIVKLLLEHHADVHARNNKGQTSFDVAARKGNTGICKLLIAAGAKVEIDQGTLVNAVKNRRFYGEFIEMLLEYAKVDDVSGIISASFQRRSCEMTKWLLKRTSLSVNSLDPVWFDRIAARYEVEDLKWFVKRFGNFTPTRRTITAAAMNTVDGANMMRYILSHHGDNGRRLLDSETLRYAVSNQIFGDEISLIVLDKGPIAISELALGEAVQNSRMGPQLLELLNQKAKGPKRISGQTIRKMADNWQLSETMFNTYVHLAVPYQGFDMDAKFEIMGLLDFDTLKILLSNYGRYVEPKSLATVEKQQLILGAVRNKQCAPRIVQYLQREMNVCLGQVPGMLQQMVENEKHAASLVMLLVEEATSYPHKADVLTSEDIHLILSTMDGTTIETVLKKVGHKLVFGLTTIRAALMNPKYRSTTYESLKNVRGFHETYVDEQALILASRCGQDGLETTKHITKEYLKEICSTNLLEAATQNEELAEFLRDMFTSEVFKTRVITAVLQNWRTSGMLLEKLSAYELQEPRIVWDDAAALGAIQQMDSGTIAKLMRSKDKPSLKVMEAAASNWAHGVEVVELLMEAPYSALAEYSSVPKEIVRAAAANWKCGLSILESLKTTYRKTLTVTASVLEAAAGNPRHGMQMMVFLLKAGDIGDITPSVLVSAAANIGCGARMTRTLLSEVGARAKHLITQKVLNTAAGNGCCGVSVLKELVKHEGIELNETLLRSAFSNATSGIMCMAIGLQQSIGQPRTTVKPRKMFKNGVPLIEHTFQAAIGGAIYRLDAKPILVGRERKASYNLDVQWTGIDQVYIPQSRVRIEHEWKWDDGSAVVSYLLDKKPSLVQVAHAATAAYSGNLSIVQEFLRRGVVPTDKMLYEAVQNTSHGYQLATLLLRNNPQLPITDKLLLRAATNSIFSDALLPLLLRSDFDRCLPKQVISECAVGDIATEMLLARQDPLGNEGGCKWPDVKHAAVRGIRGDNGLEIADWFWRRFGPDVAIATDILTAATSSASPLAPAICQMVFRWTDASDIPIPDVLFASAAANLLHSERILRLLMEQAYRRSVTPKLGPVLMATIKNGRSGLATLQWLLRTHFRHGSPTGLQDDDILAALRAAAGNSTHSIPIMTLLLKSFPQLVEDRIVRNNFDANRILQAAATNPSCSDAALGLLLEYIGPIRVSPSVLEAAVANASCSPEMVGKLRSLQPPQNPEGRLAEAIWVAACRNVRHAKQILSDVLKGPSYVSSNMVRAANTNTGSGIAVLKLLREWHARPDTGDGFLITRELLNNIGEHAIFDAGLGDTAQDGQNVPISLHGAALRALESDTLRDLIRSDHQLYIAEPPKNNDDYLPVSILRQIVDADHVHVHPMFLEWMKNCEDKTVARKADQRLSKATEKGYHAPVVASTSFPRHPVDLDVNTQPAITDPEQYEKLLSFFDTNPRSVRLDPLRDFLRRHNVQSIKPMLLERASKDVDCLQFLLTSFPPAYTEGVVTTSTLINATSSIPTLRLLLKTMPLKRIGTAVLEEVADNLEALQVLFEAVHPRIPRIEESVLLAAADDEEALRFLIAHSKYSQVSEALLMAAAGTPETTKMLLELDPEADVTENVLKHAVGNIKVMELLLAPRKDQETDVTEEVLIAAAESSLPVTMLLVDRVSCFPVFRLLEKSNAEVTKWILERSPGVLITNATWRSAFSELGKMRILLEHDNTFSVARFLRCCSEYSGYYSWHRFPQLTVFEEIARQPKFRIEQHDIIPLACAQKEGPSYYSKNRFWKTILDHNPGFIQDHDFLFQFIAFKLDLTPLVEALQESYCNPIHVPRGVQDMAKAVDGTSSNLPGSKCSLFSVFQYSSIFILETNQRKESCQETSGYGDPSMNLSAPMEDLHEAEDEPGLDTDHGSDTLSSDALSSNCSIASDHSQAGFGIHTTYQVDMTKCETHFDPRENSHFA